MAVMFVPIVAAPASYEVFDETYRYFRLIDKAHPDGTVTLRTYSEPHVLRNLGVTLRADKQWVIDPASRAWHERVIKAMERFPLNPGSRNPLPLAAFVTLGAFLLWWTISGLFFWAFPAWVTTIFFPLLEGYDWLHGVRIATIFGIGFGVWVGFAMRVFDVVP